MDANTLFNRFGRRVATGTVLFREGELGDTMYVIQKGSVRITRRVRDREALLAVLPVGEFFGEMAIINNRCRTATATVDEDAMLLEIDGKTFEAMVRGNSEIAIRMIKRLAERVERADRQIEILLHREPYHRVMHYLSNAAEDSGSKHPAGIEVRVGVELLCDHLGLTEPEVTAALRQLVASELIIRTWEDRFVVRERDQLTESIDRELTETGDRWEVATDGLGPSTEGRQTASHGSVQEPSADDDDSEGEEADEDLENSNSSIWG